MSAERDRCRQVERKLADLGIRAQVQSVGGEGAIALLRPEDGVVEGLLADDREGIVDACRAAGFRSVTVELFWE